ncbi:MAG: hypothetical protein IJM10_04930 [Clostridia bacterium]|nr:hypothetical protein [Clostridia bacterium]
MKKFFIIISVIVLSLLVVFFAVNVFSSHKPNTVIHCYEYSAAYDYAQDSGYDTYIIFGAKPPEFNVDKELFEYENTPEGLMIKSYSGDGVEVYIPKEYESRQVIGILSGAFDKVTVKDIYIPETVTVIKCSFD